MTDIIIETNFSSVTIIFRFLTDSGAFHEEPAERESGQSERRRCLHSAAVGWRCKSWLPDVPRH